MTARDSYRKVCGWCDRGKYIVFAFAPDLMDKGARKFCTCAARKRRAKKGGK